MHTLMQLAALAACIKHMYRLVRFAAYTKQMYRLMQKVAQSNECIYLYSRKHDHMDVKIGAVGSIDQIDV